ncbi:2-hydroxyacid dehydrogenase [Rhizobium lusitanum]|uniref:Lactate dehydrogenase-like 2-hydroxyacid dehydrogenase n=1 Tax=Rhizobium lusitanum TaxID=293958 RepID=A0A7X0MER9_9HYPH|nr:2-hydroxyacid dehydrogenase [Rhizobium lusitanum]MBB6487776.1 lactate dehydrogenase-like 2-hydroxyacid dehydrogenase [Rhizobium lusitanum]
MPILLLVVIELESENLSQIAAAGFELHLASDASERVKIIETVGESIRAVLTNGSTGLDAKEIAALPKLEIICALGAGYEKVDLAAAGARGIVVTNGPGTNDASVADHAMALLMAIARGIVQADSAARSGEWARSRYPRPMISGKKLGILGLGNIGEQIARRGAGGFGMTVAYHNRKPRDGSPWVYLPSATALAQWSDFMVIATPGGATTTHLVDTTVLDALGVDGFLINIARGSVVDTAALIDALENNRIRGAALDVIEGEPNIPSRAARLKNLILTPQYCRPFARSCASDCSTRSWQPGGAFQWTHGADARRLVPDYPSGGLQRSYREVAFLADILLSRL